MTDVQLLSSHIFRMWGILHPWCNSPTFFFSSPLLLTDLPLGLVLIRQKALVGHLPGNHKVYKITKIAVIPLSDEEPQELELEVCTHALFILLFNFCFNHAFSSLGSTSNSWNPKLVLMYPRIHYESVYDSALRMDWGVEVV